LRLDNRQAGNVTRSVSAVSPDRSRLTRPIARIEWIPIAITAVTADRLLALPSVGEVTVRGAARHVVKAAPRIDGRTRRGLSTHKHEAEGGGSYGNSGEGVAQIAFLPLIRRSNKDPSPSLSQQEVGTSQTKSASRRCAASRIATAQPARRQRSNTARKPNRRSFACTCRQCR
jgi:hypothetical protein